MVPWLEEVSSSYLEGRYKNLVVVEERQKDCSKKAKDQGKTKVFEGYAMWKTCKRSVSRLPKNVGKKEAN